MCRAKRKSTSWSTSCWPTVPPEDGRHRVPRRAVRPGPGLGALPGGLRRPGLEPRAARTVVRRLAAAGAPSAAIAQRHRLRHGGADRRRARHRGAEGPVPAAALHRRGDLVPAVQRARRRLRRGQPGHPGGARRRRVGGERPEGLDDGRPSAELRAAPRPDRPRGAQAPRDDRLPGRHACPGRRGPAAVPDHRRGRVQRGLLHRRPDPRRRPARRRGRGLAGRPHDAHERAGLHRGQRRPARCRPDRRGRATVAGALGRATTSPHGRGPPGPADVAVGRARGRPAHQPACADRAAGRGRPVPRARSAKLAFAELNKRSTSCAST